MLNIEKIKRLKELSDQGSIKLAKGIGRYILYRSLPERHRQYCYSMARYLRNLRQYDAVADPYKIIWIPNKKIRHKNINQPFPSKKGMGYIRDGDWDQQRRDIHELKLYQVYARRFHNNQPWSETGIIEIAERAIKRKGKYYGYTSIDDVLEYRCSYIDELYNRIESEGYKSQKKARTFLDDTKHDDYTALEVQVTIARDGEILFYTGHNRMVLAKILDVPKIPVMVLARHTQWQKIREGVLKGKQISIDSDTMSRSNHPDLQDVRSE